MDIWGEQAMMKFMSWTLKRPDTASFSKYKALAPNEPWYSKNYITVDENAPDSWSAGANGFVRMIEKNHEKIEAMGMHEFMICDDGTIANMGYNQVTYPNGYQYYDQTKKVLNSNETEIDLPVPTSLRYLMHTYPDIRWSVQILATSNSSGDRVTPLIEKEENQDNCIRQTKKIVELYQKAGFPITDVEVDLEKTNYENAEGYKSLLERIKNEVCIPTGTGLRVNLFAMTDDFVPSYYGWHDYKTIASAKDKNGNQAVDEFQLMTYDFSWGGSAPGPSTPLWWLKNVLEHVKKSLPVEKTYVGNAGYGRRWPLNEQRMGVTFDYKQLMQAQNGEYVHNGGKSIPAPIPGDDKRTEFPFNDQDFIPLAGFNDKDSDYQKTLLFVYDFFKVAFGERQGNIVDPGKDYITSYSAIQNPTFTGIKKKLTYPTLVQGNASYQPETGKYAPTPVVHDGTTFNLFFSNKAKWQWQGPLKDAEGKPVEGTEKCIRQEKNAGADGKLLYNFTLDKAGSYKVIAIVGFPFFGSDNFDITINGKKHSVGSNIPDWYPYYTSVQSHFWDCGKYSLSTSNEIEVGLTNGAQIGGFIICENFEDERTGGSITFPTNLQKMKKRGPKKEYGNSEIIDANFPTKMTLTGELLNRPPRPAIIWEDMFGPHISKDQSDPNAFTEKSDLTNFTYYRRADANSYSNGSGGTPHEVGGKTYCVDGISAVGFSKGEWKVKSEDEKDAAHAWSDCSNYGQLVLNKTLSGSAHIELDCRVLSTDSNALYGIRVMSKKGDPSTGKIFRMNFKTKQIEYIDLDNSNNNKYTDMSDSLASGVGGRYTMKLERVNGKVYFIVGSRQYFVFNDPFSSSVAYGAYGRLCTLKIYRLNVSTLDRFEPMEKILIHVDGKAYSYGEVARTVPYDEYGYLVYTGLPGNLTEAVNAIPSESENTGGSDSQPEQRAGTIFETEVKGEAWSLDYKNLPLATVKSWIGKKDVRLEMKDPGIWMRSFYVGDSEGFSVAYNSDKVGFIRTAEMIFEYECKGIAMWTLGQEDPQVFDYINKSKNSNTEAAN